jgi:small nuclear ribonucleoprotein (snRNP)-like protein
METRELENLEKFVNRILSKVKVDESWEQVEKAEWIDIAKEINFFFKQQNKNFKQQNKNEEKDIGDTYIYEHLIVNKLRRWKANQPIEDISSPKHGKLNVIARALGYRNYINFIISTSEKFNFDVLRIEFSDLLRNKPLLENLTGNWYSYNRNLPYPIGNEGEERIWRSAVVIRQAGEDFLVERSGKDNHKYFGKVNAYDEYVFIVMNSNTFIRQRHFISRIKDISTRLKDPNFKIWMLSLVSTCISFNGEPIALYEIFDRQGDEEDFSNSTIDLPLNSPDIPQHILTHLRDIGSNRITQH